MSSIAERIGDRHDTISAYFKYNTFGRTPEDLTVLSLLPPVDRCLILERVVEAGSLDFLACIDKLSMAYYAGCSCKTMWIDYCPFSQALQDNTALGFR